MLESKQLQLYVTRMQHYTYKVCWGSYSPCLASCCPTTQRPSDVRVCTCAADEPRLLA